jgi:hypothetical protein
MPARVAAAAVSEAGDVPDEDLIRAEGVSVRAPGRRAGDPFSIGGLHEVAQHIQKLKFGARHMCPRREMGLAVTAVG